MIAPCAGWCRRGSPLVTRTKPRTEPRNVFPGSAPGCPCKCTPLAPADLHDHPPTTLFQSAGGHAVLGGG